MVENDFFAPRPCLLEPVPEIWTSARLLLEATAAHLSGDTQHAETLIQKADISAIAKWTEVIWGPRNNNIQRFREVPNSPPILNKEIRPRPRMPTTDVKLRVKQRDGYFCKFCGIPVIDSSVRKRIRAAYPNALRWGTKNQEQHAAFQAMWLQYDHVLPNGRGGESSFDNVIVTCAPCNFGRMEWTLEETGLIDPRKLTKNSSWDLAATWNGLEQFI